MINDFYVICLGGGEKIFNLQLQFHLMQSVLEKGYINT